MGTDSEYLNHEVQAILQEVYRRASDLRDLLTVEILPRVGYNDYKYKKVSFRCLVKQTVAFRCVELGDNQDSDKYTLQAIKSFLDMPVANLYETFLKRFWVAKNVEYSAVEWELDNLQNQGYTIYSVTPRAIGDGVFILAHSPGAKVSRSALS